MKARLPLLLVTSLLSGILGRAQAGPWSAQPLVGIAAEYASNPELLANNPQSETHAALLLNAPVYFDDDDVHLSLTPQVRYSDTTGYSSITSNLYHVDAVAKYTYELGTLSLTSSWYRDSSLLYAAELANGVGVRRDTFNVAGEWQHTLTERSQLQLDASTAKTNYDQNSAASSNLVDYRYSTVVPSVAYLLSERDTLRLIVSAGKYKSLDGFTTSDSRNLQLGYDRSLTELWSVSLAAGYSKSNNELHFFFGDIHGSQKGGVYSATLTRKAEKLDLSLVLQRALNPTGFAFLSREESANASANYTLNERWSFHAGASFANIDDPLTSGGEQRHRYYSASLSSDWHVTEQWLLTLRANKVGQRFEQTAQSTTSTGVSIEVARQFYRTNQ